MIQNEDKELLMKDLSARLQYGVKVRISVWNEDTMECEDKVDELYSINKDGYIRTIDEDYEFEIERCEPYLFPMLSMSEEQKREYFDLLRNGGPATGPANGIAYLNKNHFDYSGLIEKCLAIDATNLNVY